MRRKSQRSHLWGTYKKSLRPQTHILILPVNNHRRHLSPSLKESILLQMSATSLLNPKAESVRRGEALRVNIAAGEGGHACLLGDITGSAQNSDDASRLTGCPQIQPRSLRNVKDAGRWLWSDHFDQGRSETIARDDDSEPYRYAMRHHLHHQCTHSGTESS